MKKIIFILISILTSQTFLFAQKKYAYDTVAGDPLKTRIYTLDNGLKVYLSDYKNEPRIQTFITVRAGSKNDPHETTGLAHYFEHMMFKGTDHIGTLDWKAEEPLVNRIDSLFEVYRFTKDSFARKQLYHIIDSLSLVASGYAVPNEYFKLASLIGAKGTNAYTSLDRTSYINDIPANRLEQWLKIESDRFTHPVLRLFHTELETIYEEKNMNLTNDARKSYTALLEGLFQKHTYGTQTTLGESEHLKNPSLKNIRKFFSDYYVPNNMAICISGDLNPDKTIRLIDHYFGSFKPGKVPEFTFIQEDSIFQPVVKEVYGPDAENITIGFRFNGANSTDVDMVTFIDMLLSNSSAGLIDLNLVKKQQVLEAYSYPMFLKDYSALMLTGKPKSGQTLDEVKNLLLSQLELIKTGNFPNNLLTAIINNMKLDRIRSYENNSSRASTMTDAFILDKSWSSVVKDLERMSHITKQNIIDFVKKGFNNNNYVVVYKRTGKDDKISAINKPPITPIKINRDQKSDFLSSIEKEGVSDIKPVFINYSKDIKTLKLKNNIPVYYKENNENEIFSLYYIFDFGTNHDKKIGIATDYLQYLGTSKYTAEEIEKKFYELACSFNVSNSTDQVYVSLSGLAENFKPALELFEHLLAEARPDSSALKNLVEDILKKRMDAKKNPRAIFSALVSYGVYGNISPFTNRLTETELRSLNPGELINKIKELTSYEHHTLFYGNHRTENLVELLNHYHQIPIQRKKIPAEYNFTEKNIFENNIYIVDFDMKQSNIVLMSKGINEFNPELDPVINLYNRYFGNGMGSLVFQDIREARSLAYSANSNYQSPARKEKSYYNISFIGTQHDKIINAIDAFKSLLNDMPESEKSFKNARSGIIQSLPTERITKTSVLFSYENAKKLGVDYDLRRTIYEKTPALTLQNIKDFQNKYIKDKPLTILILGDKTKMDVKALDKYGKITYLKMEDIFGY